MVGRKSESQISGSYESFWYYLVKGDHMQGYEEKSPHFGEKPIFNYSTHDFRILHEILMKNIPI